MEFIVNEDLMLKNILSGMVCHDGEWKYFSFNLKDGETITADDIIRQVESKRGINNE